MTVDNGASVSADYISVGTFYGATSTVTASNHGILNAAVIHLINGTLNIGRAASQEATGAGKMEADRIALYTDTLQQGEINFNHTDADYVFVSSVTGYGNINVLHGYTTLAGNNTYYGTTSVQGGTLAAGAEGAFSDKSGYAVHTGGALDLSGYNQTVYSLVNGGTVFFNQHQSSVGPPLTMNEYIGDGGTLVFNSVLEGDNSLSDRLHVKGNAAGNSYVQVNNLGGHPLSPSGFGQLYH